MVTLSVAYHYDVYQSSTTMPQIIGQQQLLSLQLSLPTVEACLTECQHCLCYYSQQGGILKEICEQCKRGCNDQGANANFSGSECYDKGWNYVNVGKQYLNMC
jgi:hypothetical protein